jgi:hypothetical protein
MRNLVIVLCFAFTGKYFIFANSTYVNEVDHNDKMIARQNKIILHLKNRADSLVSSVKARNEVDLTNALNKINSYKTSQNRLDYIDITSSRSTSSSGLNRKTQNGKSSVDVVLDEHEVEDSLILEINSMSTSYIPR